MRVVLRNPRREMVIRGPLTVSALLNRLELNPESVLVIADDELVPRDARLDDAADVEIRSVISGGVDWRRVARGTLAGEQSRITR